MKEFIFISDFDGTLTSKDFYSILLEKHLDHKIGDRLYHDWKSKKINTFTFLQSVFSSVNISEYTLHDEIIGIKFDPYARDFIRKIISAGGDFMILSGGTNYYIDRVLEYHEIKGVSVIANRGTYKDGGLWMSLDSSNKYYSESTGIDKAKVVNDLRSQYKQLFFAGDSPPDFEASLLTDLIFATGSLKSMLSAVNRQFVPFTDFSEIELYMTQKDVFPIVKTP